ncbi:MAG: hypothetical protein HC850_13270 [Rhodomicrobium sp.]|nr:hypothetical protein [Rhodomicrobium sp.]
MNSRFVLIVSALSFLVAGLASSYGQQAQRERGIVENSPQGFSVQSMTGVPGQTVPVNISVAGAAKNRQGLIMIQGIPRSIGLTRGIASGDAWLLSASELENLRLIVPGDFEGRFNMTVIFVPGEGKPRQTRSASVTIKAKGKEARAFCRPAAISKPCRLP